MTIWLDHHTVNCFGEQTTPPPQKKKYAQWRDKSCDFRSTLAVTDLISHQHHSCPLIIQMHTTKNVCYTSLKSYMQT